MEEFLEAKVEEIIEDVMKEYDLKEPFSKESMPLIRLRVDYTGYRKYSPARFGMKFVTRVANVEDILIFHKKSKKATRNAGEQDFKNDIDVMLAPRDDGKAPPIHDLIKKHLNVSDILTIRNI